MGDPRVDHATDHGPGGCTVSLLICNTQQRPLLCHTVEAPLNGKAKAVQDVCRTRYVVATISMLEPPGLSAQIMIHDACSFHHSPRVQAEQLIGALVSECKSRNLGSELTQVSFMHAFRA